MRIVPPFDEIKDRQRCFTLVAEPAAIDQLALKRGEETFTHGIVIAVADRSHRWPDACAPASLAESDRRVLRSPIGMVDHASGAALRDGHLQRLQHQLSP